MRAEIVIVMESLTQHGKLDSKILERASAHHGHQVQHDSFQQWAFSKLFPFSARWNSVLATFYISS